MTRVLVIDNYDSFVYNLVQYLGQLGVEPVVVRNDEISVQQAQQIQPEAVVISPGPGRPEAAGITCDVIKSFAGVVPLLGVCLGHQAIGQVFGATIVNAPELVHGKTSDVQHTGVGVFASLPIPFTATRYHSLIIERSSLPAHLEVTAQTSDGIIMGVRHRHLDVQGVQFHPESILTHHGYDLLREFVGAVKSNT